MDACGTKQCAVVLILAVDIYRRMVTASELRKTTKMKWPSLFFQQMILHDDIQPRVHETQKILHIRQEVLEPPAYYPNLQPLRLQHFRAT